MGKKVLCILVIVIILLVIGISVYTLLNKTSDEKPTGEIVNVSGENVPNRFPDYEIDVPEGYQTITEKNIQSNTAMYAKAIAYKYNEESKTTYLNVYLQNRGEVAFNHDSVCVVTLYDADNNLINTVGGVIEEDTDIIVGDRIVVKTQFLAKPGDPYKAEVDFENNSISEPQPLEELLNTSGERTD